MKHHSNKVVGSDGKSYWLAWMIKALCDKLDSESLMNGTFPKAATISRSQICNLRSIAETLMSISKRRYFDAKRKAAAARKEIS